MEASMLIVLGNGTSIRSVWKKPTEKDDLAQATKTDGGNVATLLTDANQKLKVISTHQTAPGQVKPADNNRKWMVVKKNGKKK